MKTAAYTICYNEIKNVDRWIEFTKDFDYRVVLDTGSTDGTYELLKKVPNIILHQKRIEPFKFNEHRNLNLKMVPEDVDWCLSPDFDEWYSINVLEQIEKTVKENPSVINITCTRLDVNLRIVFKGPPFTLPNNKIHKRHFYEWRQPIFEHLWYVGPEELVEVYNKDIFLIHYQDVTKPRFSFYKNLLIERYNEDPTDSWNSWYYLCHLYKEKNLESYIGVAINFLKFHPHKDDKYKEVYTDLTNIYRYEHSLNIEKKELILKELQLV